ncbi:MAG: NifX-associated nitrogen fixation protein [Rhodobacterales bacterium]|nr:NifX-associated nitrogen fixation protein [Rhodobacterales bacterium]
MSEAVLMIDPETATADPFFGELVRQMRAVDTYGVLDTLDNAEILDPFILTKERRREIPVIGDPDDTTLARVKGYYNALAVMIEQHVGLMATPIINLTHEGFGRALISVGKLIVIDRSLRDVHRFGFPSPAKMRDEAGAQVARAVALVAEHPTVARL